MKNRKIKMALGTVFLVGAGVAIPAWAVGLSAAQEQQCQLDISHRLDISIQIMKAAAARAQVHWTQAKRMA